MPCYFPLEGWKARHVNPKTGKRGVVFSRRDGFSDLPVTVACGQCIGCRLERSRQWAVRCVHEGQLHDSSCFLTLTYRDENLPSGGTLVKEHFQKFMKRLRRRVEGRLSFFHCGEYGELLSRPHYHALIFGFDFPDKVRFKSGVDGSDIYTSSFLESLWPHGFSTIGALTFESAAYVARYVTKKITGPMADSHYRRIDYSTGEIFQLLPEYVTMSLKPAIGKAWFDKFKSDVFPSDEVVMRGKAMKPPRYYDKLHERLDQVAHEANKWARVRKAVPHKANNTRERLSVRRAVKLSQVNLFKRSLDDSGNF